MHPFPCNQVTHVTHSVTGFCSCFYHYHLIEEPKTWNEAQQYCRNKYTDLATIYNEADIEQLIAAAGSGYEGKVWIGLYDLPKAWIWSRTNENLYVPSKETFKGWKRGRPKEITKSNKLCVVYQTGSWSDISCSELKPFVCYDESRSGEWCGVDLQISFCSFLDKCIILYQLFSIYYIS